MKKHTLLLPLLLLGGMMPCQRVHADAATELAQAMQSRRSSLQSDLSSHIVKGPRVRKFLSEETEVLSTAYRQQLVQLDRAKVKSLALYDPLLHAAYMEMFMTNFCGTVIETIPAWYTAVYSDLQQRGDAATPLLLELLAAAPGPQFGEELFFKIEDFSTISLAPYLDAARAQVRRPDTTDRTWRAISYFLSRRGIAQDLELLLDVKKHLPFEQSASISQSDIERMKKRLNGTLKPTEWHGRPPEGYHWPSPQHPEQGK